MLRPYTHRQMSKTIIAAQLDKQVFDDAQRLIEAGHFNSLDELLEAALRTFVLKYAQGSPSLVARTVQAMMSGLDALGREQFEEFVAGYAGVTQQVIDDDEMLSLLEIFNAYGFRRAMSALDDAQHSRVPLSARYLETILEKLAPPPAGVREIKNEERTPASVRAGDDPLLAEIAGLYEQEIGGLTEKVCEQLQLLVGEFPDVKRWHEAFEAAASMNKRNLRYVVGCLKNNAHKTERKGTGRRVTSKSEQVREQKRKRNQDYEDYWSERLKAKQQQRKDAES